MTKATELRMQCLDLAVRSNVGASAVDLARQFEAFALGKESASFPVAAEYQWVPVKQAEARGVVRFGQKLMQRSKVKLPYKRPSATLKALRKQLDRSIRAKAATASKRSRRAN